MGEIFELWSLAFKSEHSYNQKLVGIEDNSKLLQMRSYFERSAYTFLYIALIGVFSLVGYLLETKFRVEMVSILSIVILLCVVLTWVFSVRAHLIKRLLLVRYELLEDRIQVYCGELYKAHRRLGIYRGQDGQLKDNGYDHSAMIPELDLRLMDFASEVYTGVDFNGLTETGALKGEGIQIIGEGGVPQYPVKREGDEFLFDDATVVAQLEGVAPVGELPVDKQATGIPTVKPASEELGSLPPLEAGEGHES